jgi:hypothetical protein
MTDKRQQENDRRSEGIDVSAIVGRICEKKGFRYDAALARALGITPQSLDQAKRRGCLDLQHVLETFPDLDPTEIVWGRPGNVLDLDAALALIRSRGGRVEFPPG